MLQIKTKFCYVGQKILSKLFLFYRCILKCIISAPVFIYFVFIRCQIFLRNSSCPVNMPHCQNSKTSKDIKLFNKPNHQTLAAWSQGTMLLTEKRRQQFPLVSTGGRCCAVYEAGWKVEGLRLVGGALSWDRHSLRHKTDKHPLLKMIAHITNTFRGMCRY